MKNTFCYLSMKRLFSICIEMNIRFVWYFSFALNSLQIRVYYIKIYEFFVKTLFTRQWSPRKKILISILLRLNYPFISVITIIIFYLILEIGIPSLDFSDEKKVILIKRDFHLKGSLFQHFISWTNIQKNDFTSNSLQFSGD